MTTSEIARLRLRNQHISGARCASPAQVVDWLTAMQAQDYGQALWAIGLRTNSSTVADVEDAIERKEIVRTWPMRGTIHFIPAADARWLLALAASRVVARDAHRQQQRDLNASILDSCAEIFSRALAGGKRLTRAELLALLEQDGISTADQRGYHILSYLSQTGLLCLGPMRAKEQTFVLLDEWVPHPRLYGREQALAELARRYFASHGPATIHDLARWAGITLTDVKAGLEGARDALVSRTIDGQTWWMAEPPGGTADDAEVYLLPGFDEYLLGYKDRDAVLAAEHAHKIVPGQNGIFFPTLVLDGQVAGTWKRTVKKNAVNIVLSPFVARRGIEKHVEDAARRYSDFLGLALGEITVAKDEG